MSAAASEQANPHRRSISLLEAVEETGLPPATVKVIANLDARAFGLATGGVAGGWVLALTLSLLARGGQAAGPHLVLLSQYLPGYEVSVTGALLGGVSAAALGFLFGYAFAALRNCLVHAYFWLLWRRGGPAVDTFLDHLT